MIPLLTPSDFNGLKEILTLAAVATPASMVVMGLILFYFLARLLGNQIKPVVALVVSISDNFKEVLEASAQATVRYETRVQKHEEAMARAFDMNERLTEALKGNVTQVENIGVREAQNKALLDQLVVNYDAQTKVLNQWSLAQDTHLQLHSNTDLKIIGVQTNIDAIQKGFQDLRDEVRAAIKNKRDTSEAIVQAINDAQDKILAAIVPAKVKTGEVAKVSVPPEGSAAA